MKLVVLDGYTLNPGDFSWEPLTGIVDCHIFDRTADHEILKRAEDAALILTNKTPLSRKTLQCLPALRYIGVLATGYNVVDTETASELGIVVTNIPSYGTHSVAQTVFALLLELCSKVGKHNEAVHQGEWSNSPDWSFRHDPLVELHGKTIGIVGYGRIGSEVARIAHAFGMKIKVTGPRRPENLPSNLLWESLDDMFATADVISLHCPLLDSTRGLVHSKRIARMKSNSLLINTSRGGLIVEEDLADALNRDQIAGAALDVLSTEPPSTANPLIGAKNCIITPHIAWATREARSRLLDVAVSNVAAWLNGRQENVVNDPK